MKTYTIEDIKEAYECGFYEGAGDDAWYKDHNTPDGSLTATAFVHRPLNEYVADLTKEELIP